MNIIFQLHIFTGSWPGLPCTMTYMHKYNSIHIQIKCNNRLSIFVVTFHSTISDEIALLNRFVFIAVLRCFYYCPDYYYVLLHTHSIIIRSHYVPNGLPEIPIIYRYTMFVCDNKNANRTTA